MSTTDVGDGVTLKVNDIKNRDGAISDPTTLTFTMTEPDGTVTTYVYGTDTQLVRDSVGNYHVDWVITKVGAHVWKFDGTGTATLDEPSEFYAYPPPLQPLPGAYCSPTQVMALDAGRTYTASSQPNPRQVTQFVLQTAAVIDGILRSRGYELPVASTATSARALLEYGNTLGAAAMVELSAPAGAPNRRDEAVRMWADWRKGLAEGTVQVDDPRDPGQVTRSARSSAATAMFRRTDPDCIGRW